MKKLFELFRIFLQTYQRFRRF